MTNVVALTNNDPIQKLVTEIRGHLYDAKGAESKCAKHRLSAGQKLIELRRRVDAGEVGDGVSWWEWFENAEIGRSRKDANKLMRMAGAKDPEAAHEAEKAQRRERHGAARRAKDDAEKDYDIVDHALNLVAKMTEDQREQFDAAYMEEYHG